MSAGTTSQPKEPRNHTGHDFGFLEGSQQVDFAFLLSSVIIFPAKSKFDFLGDSNKMGAGTMIIDL